jgi:TldD protein
MTAPVAPGPHWPDPQPVVAADRGARRVVRYAAGEAPARSWSAWRGMCVSTVTALGVDHVFADGAGLLGRLAFGVDAEHAARAVLDGAEGGGAGPDHPGGTWADPAADPGAGRDADPAADTWAERFVAGHGVRLVRADHHQQVAVGTAQTLTIDRRTLSTTEVLAAEDDAWSVVVTSRRGSGGGERAEPAELAELAAAAETVRREAGCPPGQLPAAGFDLVLDPGRAGPLFHELVGHPLEADVVAAGASYLARADGLVAPPWLAVTDGPAAPGEGLAALVDDEGAPVTSTSLLAAGRVAGVLGDRVAAAGGPLAIEATGGLRIGTGHGRRLDYRHPAVSRMWHTRAWAEGIDPQEPTAPVRVHPRGLQLRWMNLLTGQAEFACAAGLIDTGEGPVRRTGPFILACRGLELLAALRPGPGPVLGSGRARKGCGKLGQFPLVTTFSSGGLWIPGEAIDVRADTGH